MEKLKSKNIIWLAKTILSWTTIISILIEIIYFPSTANLVGCIMMVISYAIFIKFLKKEIICNAPFSFFMFLSMFLYRYMPLIATLIEGKPISYGMERPIETFFLETVLFFISSIAFYASLVRIKKVNLLQRILNTVGFYTQGNEKLFWILGIFGCVAKILALSMGKVETGDVIGRLLNTIYYYIYSPIILFFPCLYDTNKKNKIDLNNKKIWIYMIVISILNLATNSRNEMITPFCILTLLLTIALVKIDVNIQNILRPSKLIKTLSIIIICSVIMSMISKSMLINRNIRENVSFTELIEITYDTLTSDKFSEIWDSYDDNLNTNRSYDKGWTEHYLDNYLLNRFCNMRITDQTLYLGDKLDSYGKRLMQEDFKNRIIAFLPQPIIEMFGLNFNKENYYNSRGDALYVYSGIGKRINWGGYRVTSHLGDGIATFGLFYFIIQFIMWYLVMILLNSFSINTKKNGRIYSMYGLLTVYISLLMFSNANGIIADFNFCLRIYWQNIILFLIIFKLARFISLINVGKISISRRSIIKN